MLFSDTTAADRRARAGDAISRAAAIAAALGRPPARAPSRAPRAELGDRPGAAAARWEVGVASARPLADWVITLDAADGSVMSSRDMLRPGDRRPRRSSTPNAVVANDGYAGAEGPQGQGLALLTSLREPVTLDNLNDGQGCLKGNYVNVKRRQEGQEGLHASLDCTSVKRRQPPSRP